MDRILVAVDEDALADKVATTAATLAHQLGAAAVICHVMSEEQYRKIEEQQLRDEKAYSVSHAEEDAHAVAAAAASHLHAAGIEYEVVGIVGEPAPTIVSLAQKKDADLIVMGFEGLHGLGRLRALGSVSRAVMEETRRPVLIVPAVPDQT
jgi:nucleotide-binding universal stress UspA family protein